MTAEPKNAEELRKLTYSMFMLWDGYVQKYYPGETYFSGDSYYPDENSDTKKRSINQPLVEGKN